MRVRRLDLIRYGCFTNEKVNLPQGDPDLHIVVGPNEAGKSTVMSALEDLLFGIPSRSTLDFIHDYKDMRLGAAMESDGRSLEVQRRKGTKNTLLAADGVPLPNGERALSPFLGDSTRDRLERMFSLDHERLRRGGREILEAKGDVGEALFSAGSGFQDLRKHRRALDDEADQLWSKRRSGRRKYYQAEDRLKMAESDLRSQTVSAHAWRELQGKYEACNKAHEELRAKLEAKDAELRKLNRIRRQARYVNDKSRLEDDIQKLGDVSAIPQDSRETLQRAERDVQVAARIVKDQEVALRRAKSERAALGWDESLLLRAKDVDRLYERWIQVRAEKADLPKREAELAAEEGKLRAFASELGWTGESIADIIEQIPPRSKVAEARAFLKRLAERLAEIKSTQSALKEAGVRLADTKDRLGEIDVPADVSGLTALITATKRDFGEVGSRIRSAESDVAEAETNARVLFGDLRPRPESIAIASSLPAPSKEEVQLHRDARLALDHKLDDCNERIRSTENDLATREMARDRIEADEQPVSRRQVIELRETRDSGWDLVRRKYVDREPVLTNEVRDFETDHGSLAEAYESAVQAADQAADRSVETANAVARLEEAGRSIESARNNLNAMQRELRHLSERSQAMDSRWRQMWDAAPFDALGPDGMLSWLEARTSLRQAVARQASSEQRLATLRGHEAGAADALVAELQSLGVDAASRRNQGLPVLLDRAEVEQRRHLEASTRRAELEVGSRRAAAEVEAKRGEAERALSAERAWQRDWSSVVNALGLAPDAKPEAVEAQVDVIDKMRVVLAEIANLRDRRVVLIQRDIAEFEEDLHKVVVAIAPGLLGKVSDDAAIELRRLLDEGRQARKDALAKAREIEELEGRFRNHTEAKRKAEGDILALQAAAGAETIEALKDEIDKAERAERCRAELSEVIDQLLRDGDGLSVEEIQDECRDVDLDKAASREEALRNEIEELRKQQLDARDSLREAEAAYEAVGGSDAAALAEGARQNALAEIGEIAGQYVRTRSAALLLQWAIDRNRREKQAPMMERAGKIFAGLTLGSFEALELDFDERDQARLVGRRPSGDRVEVDGMSSGSADQLYLALRVAALEDYIEGAQPLPFVADDLFINFDDQRSAAGFRVLRRLARKCQVIFFTHHEHLAEVANLAIPEAVHVWRMAD